MRSRFARRQVGTNAHPFRQLVGIDRRLRVDLHHVERRRARRSRSSHDLIAHAGHDRRHRHDRRDADDDAEDRQGRPQLARRASRSPCRRSRGAGRGVSSQSVWPRALSPQRSDGSSLAARDAGYTPKITPTGAQRERADDRPVVTRAGSGDATAISAANPQPPSTPSAPPSTASIIDSARNCGRMSARVAPTDLRSPISCVRSRTDINMMFMITMPPTTMPIADHRRNDREQHLRELLPEIRRARRPSRRKSRSSSPGRRWCATRIASSARCIAGATSTASFILTEIGRRTAPAVHRLERRDRQHDEPVERLAEHATFRGDGADDRERERRARESLCRPD